MRKYLAWLIIVAYLLMAAGAALAQPQIPSKPAGSIYVQDYAKVLTPQTKQRINDIGSKLADKTKAQVVVVTVKTVGGTPIEEYALAVLRQWGIGDKTLNNGVLLLVAVDDRQSRIEVGYGLEGALPDAKTGEIQDDYMIPYFRQGDYDQGIMNGYLALVKAVAKEYNLELKTNPTKPAVKTQPASSVSWWDTLPWYGKLLIAGGMMLVFILDWVFFGGAITYFILSVIRFRGGGGGGGGFGGGSGGGGGSSRRW